MANKTNWKEQKLDYLDFMYGKYARMFDNKGYGDDRQLFANCYNQIIEAVNTLRQNPHVIVRVAINDYIKEREEVCLKPIVNKFKDGLWEGRM